MQNRRERTVTPCVAVLSGAEDMAEAVVAAQMEIGYFHDPDFGVEYLDFDSIPPLDAVAAVLPPEPGDLRQQLELAFLFVRARKPASFLFVSQSDAAVSRINRRADEMGYDVQTHRAAGRVFVVGTLPGVAFTWPQVPSGEPDPVKARLIAAAVRVREAVLGDENGEKR